jgi:hypothetical protein
MAPVFVLTLKDIWSLRSGVRALLFGHFAHRLIGKAHAGTDSDLLNHRFSGVWENPSGPISDREKKARQKLPGAGKICRVDRQIIPH